MTEEFNEEGLGEDEEFDDTDLEVGAEIVKAIALANRFDAEAEHLKWQAKREELAYQQEKLAHEWQLDGTYSFHSRVTQKAADKFLRALSVWHRVDPQAPWTIYLNSVGGSIYAGNSMIDELIAHSIRGNGTHYVTIKVRGVALSMGSLILQAADERVMGANSMLMIHRGSVELGSRTAEEITDLAEWFRRDTDWMISYFLKRTSQITRPEFLRNIDHRDWWLNSDEAKAIGFVDRIG